MEKNLFVSVTLVQGYKLVEVDIASNTLKSLRTQSVDLRFFYFGTFLLLLLTVTLVQGYKLVGLDIA